MKIAIWTDAQTPPLGEDRAKREEGAGGHSAQESGRDPEGRVALSLLRGHGAFAGGAGAAPWVKAIGTSASEMMQAMMQNGLKPAGSVAGRRSWPLTPASNPVIP